MKLDPIIQELRTVRQEIEKECGGTADGYVERLRSVEKKHASSRLVRFGPKPLSGSIGRVAEADEPYGVRRKM